MQEETPVLDHRRRGLQGGNLQGAHRGRPGLAKRVVAGELDVYRAADELPAAFGGLTNPERVPTASALLVSLARHSGARRRREPGIHNHGSYKTGSCASSRTRGGYGFRAPRYRSATE